jgi:hypothetical protein
VSNKAGWYRRVAVVLMILMMASCTKGPGEGGTSTIKGKVFVRDFNGSGQLQGEYYGVEERVYIIYGDDDFYGNDTRTSFDGTYEFQYLKKGLYTIFAYTECDTCLSGLAPVLINAEITENHATVELEDLVIIK